MSPCDQHQEEEEEEEELASPQPEPFKTKTRHGARRKSKSASSRVSIAMSTVKELFGEVIEFPMRVVVHAPGEGMKQLVWLRSHSTAQADLWFSEPLLSKVKSYHGNHRRWSLGQSEPDGTPCLVLNLRTKKMKAGKKVGFRKLTPYA